MHSIWRPGPSAPRSPGVKIGKRSHSGGPLSERDVVAERGELAGQLVGVAFGRVTADEPVRPEILVGDQPVKDVVGSDQYRVGNGELGLGRTATSSQAGVLGRQVSPFGPSRCVGRLSEVGT